MFVVVAELRVSNSFLGALLRHGRIARRFRGPTCVLCRPLDFQMIILNGCGASELSAPRVKTCFENAQGFQGLFGTVVECSLLLRLTLADCGEEVAQRKEASGGSCTEKRSERGSCTEKCGYSAGLIEEAYPSICCRCFATPAVFYVRS